MSKARGEGHHFATLTQKQVDQIRLLLEQREKVRKLMEGLTFEAIGEKVGCGRNAVWHIHKKHSWKQR